MAPTTRRGFIKRSAAIASGVMVLENANSVRAAPANEQVVLGLIGAGGRGRNLAVGFLERDDCRFAYLADADTSKFGRADEFEKLQGTRPKCEQDFRRVLEDPSVDAVIIATPDHWHAPATVLACQHEKDVYVEKPASHSVWEGRKMVQAARKYRRVVQVGTQNRSAPYNMAAKRYIDEGRLGDIHLCRVYNQKWELPTFDSLSFGPAPTSLDWDMWNGPAPQTQYAPELHHHWHSWWRYSGGDLANDGVHQMDLARWLCGVDYPKTVFAQGGSYTGGGIRDEPDTQSIIYEFDRMLMAFDMTRFGDYMLKTDGGVRESDMFPYWMQNATRIEIFGTKGLMMVGRHGGGWQVFTRPKSREPVVVEQAYGRFPDPEHKENFLSCVRSRALPSADILQGHLSAALVHYANMSLRAGAVKLQIDPTTERPTNCEAADALFKRTYREPWVIGEEV